MGQKLLEIPDDVLMYLYPFLDYIVGTNADSKTIYMRLPVDVYKNWDDLDYTALETMGVAQIKLRKAGLCNIPDRNGNMVGLGFTHYEIDLTLRNVNTVDESSPQLLCLPISKKLKSKVRKLVARLKALNIIPSSCGKVG